MPTFIPPKMHERVTVEHVLYFSKVAEPDPEQVTQSKPFGGIDGIEKILDAVAELSPEVYPYCSVTSTVLLDGEWIAETTMEDIRGLRSLSERSENRKTWELLQTAVAELEKAKRFIRVKGIQRNFDAFEKEERAL